MHLESNSKEYLKSHIVVARAGGEGDKYAIRGIVYLLPWYIY